MRQLVDDGYLGLAGDDRVQVHLGLGGVAILDGAGRNDFEVADFVRGLGAVVGHDQSDHHVDPALARSLVSFFQHLVGFSLLRGCADIDLQPPLERSRDQVEERLRIGPMVILYRMGCHGPMILLFQPRLGSRRSQFVERKVKRKHVDARLTEHA